MSFWGKLNILSDLPLAIDLFKSGGGTGGIVPPPPPPPPTMFIITETGLQIISEDGNNLIIE